VRAAATLGAELSTVRQAAVARSLRYRVLLAERGWSGDGYEEWLGSTLILTLLKAKA
jgi:hypothetical protein